MKNCFQENGDKNMNNMGYRPKFYDCTIDGIKSIKGKKFICLTLERFKKRWKYADSGRSTIRINS